MAIAEANEPLVKNMKMLIASRGLKNGYVAKEAGYTAQEFSDMLNGRKLIKVCDIPKLAKALGVSTDRLCRIEEGGI